MIEPPSRRDTWLKELLAAPSVPEPPRWCARCGREVRHAVAVYIETERHDRAAAVTAAVLLHPGPCFQAYWEKNKPPDPLTDPLFWGGFPF